MYAPHLPTPLYTCDVLFLYERTAKTLPVHQVKKSCVVPTNYYCSSRLPGRLHTTMHTPGRSLLSTYRFTPCLCIIASGMSHRVRYLERKRGAINHLRSDSMRELFAMAVVSHQCVRERNIRLAYLFCTCPQCTTRNKKKEQGDSESYEYLISTTACTRIPYPRLNDVKRFELRSRSTRGLETTQLHICMKPDFLHANPTPPLSSLSPFLSFPFPPLLRDGPAFPLYRRLQHQHKLQPHQLQLQLEQQMGGNDYAQSTALLRYAGKLGGMYPEDPLEALQVGMSPC